MPDKSFLDWPFFEQRHRDLVARLEPWIEREIAPHEHEEGDVDALSVRFVRALGRDGWLNLVVPAPFGGEADTLDVRSLCLMRETLARTSGLSDFAFAMQGLGSASISLFGSPELKQRYLPKVASGAQVAAFALSEPEGGSDVASLRTTAKLDGDHYRLSGSKTWISNAGIADHYVVFARTGDAEGSRGLSAFVVDADTPGLRVSERINVIAPHPLGTLVFDNASVPMSQRLGASGQGFKIAMSTLDIFRSTVGAAALGFARRALDEAVRRTQARDSFGQKLSTFQATQMRLGGYGGRGGRCGPADLPRGLDPRLHRGPRDPRSCDGEDVCDGGRAARDRQRRAAVRRNGRGVRVPVERLYREIRALRIYEGTTEIQKLGDRLSASVEACARCGESRRIRPDGKGHERNGAPFEPTALVDTFGRDNLPPVEDWPLMDWQSLPELAAYPRRLNAAVELLDRMVERGHGESPCLRFGAEIWTYHQLLDKANRIANVLVRELGLVSGNRVLLRAANNPMMVACWFAVLKAGASRSQPCRCCAPRSSPTRSARPG